ncbi:helix-turn-helix transcriptional regulator [Neobacillus sp. 3P2-tot-E-2]|uniref:helix-turn-helix domain-containing protein n=1 Tax=Neobacillus sp. 3P2-tot-E-2 TaxID=3132212 RepID=UPI0039A2A76F
MDGNRLKVMRKEKGISLSKLSELTGISKSYLSLIERNIQKNPSIDILGKLARTLEIDIEDLVRTEEAEKEMFCKWMPSGNSKLKLEIELSGDQLTPERLNQIREIIKVFHSD